MWADVGEVGGGGKLRELRRTHRVCRVVPALEGREFKLLLYPEVFISHSAPHSGNMAGSFVIGNVAWGDPS